MIVVGDLQVKVHWLMRKADLVPYTEPIRSRDISVVDPPVSVKCPLLNDPKNRRHWTIKGQCVHFL